MNSACLAVIQSVLSRASRREPADAVLRAILRDSKGISRRESREISRTVFAYYRWRGWIETSSPLARQVREVMVLAERFTLETGWPPHAELLERAIPEWIRRFAETPPAWLRSLQAEPRLWLRARPGLRQSLIRMLNEHTASAPPENLDDGEPQHAHSVESGPLPDCLEYAGDADLFRLPAFQAGDFEIQDISSQAVGILSDPQPGETWWDACAGEGGKTLHLSALMENRGLIWASDRLGWRLERLKRRAARAGCFNYRMARWDGGERLPTRMRFDGVLVDAPCSGIGTWQRNPHARWTSEPRDVEELAALQRQLLARVASTVKSGGKLVYAVCTIAGAETVDVAAHFSQEQPDFEPLPLHGILPFVPGAESSCGLLLWPQETGGNGMFVAAWRKK